MMTTHNPYLFRNETLYPGVVVTPMGRNADGCEVVQVSHPNGEIATYTASEQSGKGVWFRE